MTWNSFLSVLLALMAFPFGMGLWFLLCWCSNKKITKVLRRNGTQETEDVAGLLDNPNVIEED